MDPGSENFWKSLLSGLGRLWSTELFMLEGQPLTVGKLITGLVLLGIGYWVSKKGSESVEKRFLRRFDLDNSLRYTLRRILFYFFLIIATLFTLRLLNVPITIFTVLGGAVAIGIGFGSQNIVNNFISGLIMMIEQPVRVGDLIEIEGFRGKVEVIGTRSTIITTTENKELIVPNSFFLEKPVLNWTLNNNVVRAMVKVGVAYGSPLKKVEELLFMALKRVDRVLAEPKPRVAFSDFGDSALTFTIFFWCETGDLYVTEIEGLVRYAIDDIFRENKISIPFPQRDVHLYQAKN